MLSTAGAELNVHRAGICPREDEMVSAEKIAAIRGYLTGEFPGYTVEDWYEAGREAWSFRIVKGPSNHLATVSREFMEDRNAADIGPTLTTFLLAEHLRDLGTTRVIVGNEGLSLEG